MATVPFETAEVPFSPSDPLIFHVLTTLPGGGHGERRFRQLVAEGAELVPPDEAWAELSALTWSAHGSQALMRPRDVEAGDSRFLFMTPLRPFHHSVSVAGNFHRTPAVAYHLSTLIRIGAKLAFRVCDLEWAYGAITSSVEDAASLYGSDDEDDESPLDLETAQAIASAEELQEIAHYGTQFENQKAIRLLQLYTAVVAGHLDGQPALNIARDEGLVPSCDPSEWLVIPERIPASIERAWETLFLRHDHYTMRRQSIFHREPPEILVSCCVPLADADYVRDGDGFWVAPGHGA
jgi:hypothetical protein